jgi:glyoxylase-like metal-dependent hydrolase (beta-lactamase superfamily II)
MAAIVLSSPGNFVLESRRSSIGYGGYRLIYARFYNPLQHGRGRIALPKCLFHATPSFAADGLPCPNSRKASVPKVDRAKLKLAAIASLPFEENTYVAWLEGRSDCLVVDPGLEPDKIIDFLEREGLKPAAILITHGHGDHIGGNAALKQRWPECPLVIGADDAPKLTDPRLNLSASFGLGMVSPPADVLLNEPDHYQAAGFDLEVREIPGHSTGHVVFIWQHEDRHYVFGGDVLFAGSVGRSDFPDGDHQTLIEGIRQKLLTLPDDTVVLPGHGPATTTGDEARSNPFLA